MGTLTGTVKGGLFGDISETYTAVTDNSPAKRSVAQRLARRGGHRIRELATTLNGAAAGDPASKTRSRVAAYDGADVEASGGAMTIETETIVSRNTAAADVTEINEDMYAFGGVNSSFPANGDGNPRGYNE